MKINDLDSIKYLEEQIKGFKLILKANRGLLSIGLGSKKLIDQEEKIIEIEKRLEGLKNLFQKFNDYFSDLGWVTHDTLNSDLIKKAVKKYEEKGIKEAEKEILNYYKPDNVEKFLILLRISPEFLKRYRFIEFAFNDYKEEKYYSTIPILIMIIDGVVNEALGKGFHTDKADLDVWDSITSVDNGINKIRNIFLKGRKKVTEDTITMPYRNGILHGMDLGYDNYIVAAKCWHFLFVVKDWLLSKRSENSRKEKFLKDKKIPSVNELLEQGRNINLQKEAIKKWKPRDISKEYIGKINKGYYPDKELPEYIAIKFLDLWIKRNYGYMADLYWLTLSNNSKSYVKEVRDLFSLKIIKEYLLIEICDKSPDITEVRLRAKMEDNCFKEFTIRLLYESLDGNALPRSLKKGKWVVVSALEM